MHLADEAKHAMNESIVYLTVRAGTLPESWNWVERVKWLNRLGWCDENIKDSPFIDWALPRLVRREYQYASWLTAVTSFTIEDAVFYLETVCQSPS